MPQKTSVARWSNQELIIPYAAPYFAYVAISSVLHNKISVEFNYCLKLVIVPALLAWAWKWYVPLTGPKSKVVSSLYGVVFGIVGLVVWVALFAPFTTPGQEPWTVPGFVLRLVTASLVVPVFEELMMRGFVYRVALQWDEFRKQNVKQPLWHTLEHADISTVSPGAWNWAAVWISTVIFTLGHTTPEWPAGIAYGLLMAFLWIIRKDLLSCIVAHGVTNMGLALYVYYTGSWELW